MTVSKGRQGRTRTPASYGKVAVLLGGSSAEREISLQTGEAVHAALCRSGVEASMIDATGDFLERVSKGGHDRVFIALHGRGGEDGTLQGALEILGIPYTGSGVAASALAMDKTRSKWIWQSQGLDTPPFAEVGDLATLREAASRIGFPLMIKPVQEGSSCGASRVDDEAGLEAAFEQAWSYDRRVMAERWITGEEYTVGILGDAPLPSIRLETPRRFYDYEAKYLADTTRYICPSGLGTAEETGIASLAFRAFQLLGAGGWGRVDLMRDADGRCWLLELNTVPGMTSHSLVPMAARQAGLDFDELVLRILDSSLAREGAGRRGEAA